MIFPLRSILILSLLWLASCGPSYHVTCYSDKGAKILDGTAMLYDPVAVTTSSGRTVNTKYMQCEYKEI